jgi:hypothetical protein
MTTPKVGSGPCSAGIVRASQPLERAAVKGSQRMSHDTCHTMTGVTYTMCCPPASGYVVAAELVC